MFNRRRLRQSWCSVAIGCDEANRTSLSRDEGANWHWSHEAVWGKRCVQQEGISLSPYCAYSRNASGRPILICSNARTRARHAVQLRCGCLPSVAKSLTGCTTDMNATMCPESASDSKYPRPAARAARKARRRSLRNSKAGCSAARRSGCETTRRSRRRRRRRRTKELRRTTGSWSTELCTRSAR